MQTPPHTLPVRYEPSPPATAPVGIMPSNPILTTPACSERISPVTAPINGVEKRRPALANSTERKSCSSVSGSPGTARRPLPIDPAGDDGRLGDDDKNQGK